MGLMNDFFKRGFLFDGVTGEKTGANLEDLVTRAIPVSGTQLVDQSTLEDYEDTGVVDDAGAAVRRLRVKDGGITTAKLAAGAVTPDKLGDGTNALITVFGSAAAAASAMNMLVGGSPLSQAPTNIANIFDGSDSTYWTEAIGAAASNVLFYWDLGAVYKGELFLLADGLVNISIAGASMYMYASATIDTPSATWPADSSYYFSNSTETYCKFSNIKPFYGRYVGFLLNGNSNGTPRLRVRRFEVHAKAV